MLLILDPEIDLCFLFCDFFQFTFSRRGSGWNQPAAFFSIFQPFHSPSWGLFSDTLCSKLALHRPILLDIDVAHPQKYDPCCHVFCHGCLHPTFYCLVSARHFDAGVFSNPPHQRPAVAPNVAKFGKLVDLHMLLLVDGAERTREELDQLAAPAGLRVTRVAETAARCIVELREQGRMTRVAETWGSPCLFKVSHFVLNGRKSLIEKTV